MTIGELAKRTGVRASRLRYYECTGILPKPERRSGARRYDLATVLVVRNVLIAQRLGFSLAEIRAVREGSESLASVAEARARAAGVKVRRARVVGALLRHASRAGTLATERYERILTKFENDYGFDKNVSSTRTPFGSRTKS